VPSGTTGFLGRALPQLRGTVEDHTLDSVALGTSRQVTVYRPPEPAGPLPGCVLADGESARGFALSLESAILAGSVDLNSGQSDRRLLNVRSAGKPRIFQSWQRSPRTWQDRTSLQLSTFPQARLSTDSQELTCDFVRIIHKSMHRQLSWQVERLRVSTSQGRKP
jgi:hypothetical protein